MPFEWIKREWRDLRDAEPGRRFEQGHDRHRVGNYAVRVTLIVLGATLMVLGAVTFWVPGPNFVVVLTGLILVAGQWRLVARWLDRGEVKLRDLDDRYWDPYPHKRRLLLTLWLCGVTLVLGLAWFAWRQGWLPAWLPLIG